MGFMDLSVWHVNFKGVITIRKNPTMKNLFKPTLLVVLMSLTLASTSNAFSETPKTNKIEKMSDEDSQRMINRLEEIKSMDVSTMTRKEKKELRHEVKAIKHTLRTQSSGVYVSVGALLIIILLVIILL